MPPSRCGPPAADGAPGGGRSRRNRLRCTLLGRLEPDDHFHAISADLGIPPEGAEGIIVVAADHLGGFALFVKDGTLRHTYSLMGVRVFRQVAEAPLPTGSVYVRPEFASGS